MSAVAAALILVLFMPGTSRIVDALTRIAYALERIAKAAEKNEKARGER